MEHAQSEEILSLTAHARGCKLNVILYNVLLINMKVIFIFTGAFILNTINSSRGTAGQ